MIALVIWVLHVWWYRYLQFIETKLARIYIWYVFFLLLIISHDKPWHIRWYCKTASLTSIRMKIASSRSKNRIIVLISEYRSDNFIQRVVDRRQMTLAQNQLPNYGAREASTFTYSIFSQHDINFVTSVDGSLSEILQFAQQFCACRTYVQLEWFDFLTLYCRRYRYLRSAEREKWLEMEWELSQSFHLHLHIWIRIHTWLIRVRATSCDNDNIHRQQHRSPKCFAHFISLESINDDINHMPLISKTTEHEPMKK